MKLIHLFWKHNRQTKDFRYIFPAGFITVLRRKGCHTRLLSCGGESRFVRWPSVFRRSFTIHSGRNFQTISKNYDVFSFILNVIEYDKIEVVCLLKMVETRTIWIEFLAQYIPMRNEGLCTIVTHSFCISYHLTMGSKYLLAQVQWFLYQNQLEPSSGILHHNWLSWFCSNDTTCLFVCEFWGLVLCTSFLSLFTVPSILPPSWRL